MLVASGFLLLGIALLYYGGELLVDNAVRLARAWGVTPMVIGLTVVAFGTSAPELAATVTAGLKGSPDIAVGNVFGSNVANLAFILGLSAMILPFTVTVRFLRREVAFMLVATLLVYPLMWSDWLLSRGEGVFLFLLLLGFLFVLLRDPEAQVDQLSHSGEIENTPQRATWLAALLAAVGIGLLVAGAQSLVSGATIIALTLGVSERIIGLTIVAFGTSLPELAASVVAARKGEGDIVLGNLVGSNIFNLLSILGLTALVVPIPISPASLQLDFWFMFVISVLVLIFLALDLKLQRWEGSVLVVAYLGYLVYLYMVG